MKYLLLLISLLAINVNAQGITDIFDMSFSSTGDYTTATLNASFDISDSLRILGEVDNQSYYDLGLGKAFLFDDLFNEIYFKVSHSGYYDRKGHLGWFIAGQLTNKTTWFVNSELGYANSYDAAVLEETLNLDSLVGVSYQANRYLSFDYAFNHDNTHANTMIGDTSNTNSYHDITMHINIKGVVPYATYTHNTDRDKDSSVEAGVNFRF